MTNTIHRFQKIIEQTPTLLSRISESESGIKPPSGKWSKKEILGHVIDSATNNLQRFVRAQLQNPCSFPNYQQKEWVSTQHYQQESWKDLIQLWESVNKHLLHLISHIPEEKKNNIITIGTNPSTTLSDLAKDYLSHLEHHLNQILPKENK